MPDAALPLELQRFVGATSPTVDDERLLAAILSADCGEGGKWYDQAEYDRQVQHGVDPAA